MSKCAQPAWIFIARYSLASIARASTLPVNANGFRATGEFIRADSGFVTRRLYGSFACFTGVDY